MVNSIAAPAGFVPIMALAVGALGSDAQPVDPNNPMPVTDPSSDEVLQLLQNIFDALTAQVTSLPHFAPDKTRDLSRALVGFTGTGDQDIVALAAGETIRLHKLFLSFAGATTFSIYSGGSGGALLFAQDIPSAGILSLDFDPRPWAISVAGEKMTFKTTASVAVKGFADYLRSA